MSDIHEIVQFVIKRLDDGKSLRGAISELRDKGYSEDEIRDVLLSYKEYMAKRQKEATEVVKEQEADEKKENDKRPYVQEEDEDSKPDASSEAIKKALKKAMKEERHQRGVEDPDKDLFVDVEGGKIDKAFDELDTSSKYSTYSPQSNSAYDLQRPHHSNNMLWVTVFMIPLLIFAVIFILTRVLKII